MMLSNRPCAGALGQGPSQVGAAAGEIQVTLVG